MSGLRELAGCSIDVTGFTAGALWPECSLRSGFTWRGSIGLAMPFLSGSKMQVWDSPAQLCSGLRFTKPCSEQPRFGWPGLREISPPE